MSVGHEDHVRPEYRDVLVDPTSLVCDEENVKEVCTDRKSTAAADGADSVSLNTESLAEQTEIIH